VFLVGLAGKSLGDPARLLHASRGSALCARGSAAAGPVGRRGQEKTQSHSRRTGKWVRREVARCKGGSAASQRPALGLSAIFQWTAAGRLHSEMEPDAGPACDSEEQWQRTEARAVRRERLLQQLRDNARDMTTLQLPFDAVEYMYRPSGRFEGSELEVALSCNSVVTSVSVDHPHFRGSRPKISGPAFKVFCMTLEGLRGCSLPLYLCWNRSKVGTGVMQMANCLGEAVRGEGSVARGVGDPLKICGLDLRFSGLRLEELDALLAVELPHLTTLHLALNPIGPACGPALVNLLERNRQLTTLGLDEAQLQHLERYEEEVNCSKLLAFAMGLHRKLGKSSLIRPLGHVRGDQDHTQVYDVPLFRAIAEHVLAPSSNRPTILLTKLNWVNLRVKGQDGKFRHIQFGRNTQFRELKEILCAGSVCQASFFYEGSALGDTQTPETLEMLDDDVISTRTFL
jgi:hypothetical protein